MIKKIFITVIISLFATLIITAQKNVIDEIIWVVGEEAILRSDVENYRMFMQHNGMRIEGDPYCIVPEQLALQKLYLSQAKIDSIEADESTVIRQVDYWVNYSIQNAGSREKLEEWMGKKLAQIKEDQKRVVREQQIEGEMKKKIVGDIKLRPSDVTRYFNQISKDSLPMIPTTVEVAVIMMEPVVPVEDIDAIKARLRSYTEMVNNGETTFDFLAIRYSEDPSSGNGGDIGMMSKVNLSPEYATAAFALKEPNQISNVVQTEYGFHIIQLIEKRGDRIHTRHILLRPQVSDQEINKALVRLDSLHAAIHDGRLTFEEAATYFSSDKETRNNNGLMVNQNEESRNYSSSKFEMEELPQGMGVQIDKMEVGEISKPFRMKNIHQNDVVVFVKLKSRVNVHQANLQDDYQELKELVENQKKEEILKDWIVGKQKTTYIRISDDWCDCDFKFPGWKKEQ